MDKLRINTIMKQYDAVVHKEEEVNIEFWYARELMPLLGYERWENFEKAISRAMSSCETSGIETLDHFREVTKMVIQRKKKLPLHRVILQFKQGSRN